MAGPAETSFLNIIQEITYTTSQTPGEIGRFDVKNEEKMLLNANKIGKLFGSRNTVRREAFFWDERSTQRATGKV